MGGIKQVDAADAQLRILRRRFGNVDLLQNATAQSNWITIPDEISSRSSITTLANELGHSLRNSHSQGKYRIVMIRSIFLDSKIWNGLFDCKRSNNQVRKI